MKTTMLLLLAMMAGCDHLAIGTDSAPPGTDTAMGSDSGTGSDSAAVGSDAAPTNGGCGVIAIPSSWTCDPALYWEAAQCAIERYCDCGCGTLDLDCGMGMDPFTRGIACERCWTAGGATERPCGG